MEDIELIAKLTDYLQNSPSTFLNFQKVQRILGLSEAKLNQLFTYLESNNIGQRIYPYPIKNQEIDLVPYCKFYFYDYDLNFKNKNLRTDQQGALLEQYFFSQVHALNLFEIFTFRTTNNIEIDFILKNQNELIAIEIKKDQFIYAGDLGHLHYFNKLIEGKKELFVLHNGIRDNFEGVVHICPIDKYISTLKTK